MVLTAENYYSQEANSLEKKSWKNRWNSMTRC